MRLCRHGRVKGFGKTVFCDLVTAARRAASPAAARALRPFAGQEDWTLFFYLGPSPLKTYHSSSTWPQPRSAAVCLPGVCRSAWTEFFLFVLSQLQGDIEKYRLGKICTRRFAAVAGCGGTSFHLLASPPSETRARLLAKA